MKLRNQGQVLGAEREGDYIRATGRWEGPNKLFASVVDVISQEEAMSDIDPVALEALATDATPTAESGVNASSQTASPVPR